MITSFLLFFMGLILQIIGLIFGAISWALPPQIFDAIEFFFAKIHSLDFLFPTETFMEALGVLITFFVGWYTVKIVLWGYHLIRHGAKASPAKVKN